MSRHTDLENLERRTYLAYFQDGLLDLGLGLVVMAFGVGMVIDFPLAAIFAPMLVPVGIGLKRLITYPRLGFVRFSSTRQEQERRTQVMFIVLGVLGLVVGVTMFVGVGGIVAGAQDWARANTGVLLGALIAAATLAGGTVFSIRRFYAYAAVVFAAFALMERVDAVHPGYVVACGGGVVALAGLWVLARFVASNPVVGDGEE